MWLPCGNTASLFKVWEIATARRDRLTGAISPLAAIAAAP
jgi:hypothetical protein